MEHFSFECGHGQYRRTHIKPFKKELAWAVDEWLWVINTIILFKKQQEY